MPMAFEGSKRRNLLFSMMILAGLIGGAVFGTAAFSMYFRSQDPVNQCIDDPESQSFQLSVPVTVIEDGFAALVPRGVGIEDNNNSCIRPVHTVEENVIHVAYDRPYDFTLGHFLYYWLGNDLLHYDTKVYINGIQHTAGDFRDIVLREGDSIRIEFTTRN
jgi:hypothetical protein